MEDLRSEYEGVVTKRETILEEIKTLLADESVQRYLKLCEENDSLFNKQKRLYVKIKENEFASCSHIWIFSQIAYDRFEGRSDKSCGCIKCGLNQEVLDYPWSEKKFLSTDGQIMYDFMYNHHYRTGINTNILCDFTLARAIYLKIKAHHPNIDDKTALKYFEIALSDIRNIRVSEDRKVSRAKRLSLDPKFNRWNGSDVWI